MGKKKKNILPSGNFRARIFIGYDDQKKRIYEFVTASTQDDLKLAVANRKKEIHRGIAKPDEMTLGEAFDRYIAAKSNVMSPATVREYKRSRKNDLTQLMGYNIKEITQELVQSAINIESASHAPKTVRNMHGLLSAVLGMFRPEFVLKTQLPQKTKNHIEIPTDDKIKQLIKSVEGTPIEIPILLSAFGSLRRSEICALKKSDITDHGVWVKRAMVMNEDKQWEIKSPKTTESFREAMLPPFVLEKLRSVPEREDGMIIQISPNCVTNQFVNAAKKAGLENVRFHDLRHYWASICYALDMPALYIMKNGGWSSMSTPNKVYLHIVEEKNKKVSNAVQDHFKKLI